MAASGAQITAAATSAGRLAKNGFSPATATHHSTRISATSSAAWAALRPGDPRNRPGGARITGGASGSARISGSRSSPVWPGM